jgi:hypothetical protein
MNTYKDRASPMARTSEAQIVYVSRPDAVPSAEPGTLAAVYRFILFESRASKVGGTATAPDDPKKDKDARTYFYSI